MADATAVERWVPIPGHEGYEVSDLGHLRSLDRVIHCRNGKRLRRRGQPLRRWQERGYWMVRLGSGRQWAVHRLVLTAFVGPCPDGMEGCHNDGDPSNARLSNLRWDTPRENAQDVIRHGRNHELNKRCCVRGHLLEGRNLKLAGPDGTHRNCRACLKAHRKIRWCREAGFIPPDFQEESDRWYAAILAGRTDGRAGRKITKWLPLDQQPRRSAS